jgi:predicted esterase
MSRASRTWLRSSLWLVWLVAGAWLGGAAWAPASTIVLKDGRRLHGSIGKVSGLADNPLSSKAAGDPATITFVDDELKRVFVPTFQILRKEEADVGEVPEKIGIKQHVAKSGSKINRVGPIVKVGQFDKWGRRTFTMMTDKGPLDVVQGITQITPDWTKVEGLVPQKSTPLIWDMRIDTKSIPRETLHKILSQVDPKKLEQRLRIVRLFLQQERYLDAQEELEGVVADFPDRRELAEQVQALRQLHARSIVKEIDSRRKAGQHFLASALLEKFPAQDVAGETLQQVREMLEDYRDMQSKLQQAYAELTTHVATIADPGRRQDCEAMLKEMSQEASVNTLPRLAAYLRLSDDESLGPEQKIALALSGWLMGSDQADTNLVVALSLAKIRAIVHRYLNEPVKLEREQLVHQLHGQEGASPARVAQLIAHMKPPLSSPDPSVGAPGFYKFQVPVGIDKEPDATYCVQLPPEYDPYVRYPTILTLNGAGTSPEIQIDWWAGGERDPRGIRKGQASRLGYIVIAVDWLKEGQKEYEFSAREHAAVLVSLRDACRRFAVDTDRVFLTGHSIGGNAAWDLGLAHPDLWAGVIPIVAQSQKYCSHYWENANLVPFYVLSGEFDGDKTVKNAPDLNRYMTRRFDVTVVEYRGRGHEDFYEDIQNIFDWMGRREPRNFFPKQFTVATMRTWDNYFWWLEAGKLPDRGVVEPADWPPPRGVRPVQIKANVLATNGLAITSGGSNFTVWLAPEVVDFNRQIRVTLNGSSISKNTRIDADLSVLLEDVRTRADRLHPFWAKVEP